MIKIRIEKLSVCVGVDYVTPPADKLSHSIVCMEEGVDYILIHLQEPLFPRDIMTKKLGHKIEVFDKKSMLWHFKESDYQDCRISAYPRLTQYKGINLVAPTLIMIDLDLNNLGTELALEKALNNTLVRIHQILKTTPTVLWTGNGYHIYLPMQAIVLEEEEVFTKFQYQNSHANEPSLSTKFMRFAEAYFTNKKHDPQHRPSVNSCLLRVPGTNNSKNGQRVKVVLQWNGKRPAIQYVLRDFRKYLIQEQLDKINEQKSKSSTIPEMKLIKWIDQLLQTPIHDHRRYCIWRILAPYLINVRKLSDEESCSVISRWLEKCSLKKSLSFDPKDISNQNIRNARRIGYYPISWTALKLEDVYLYKTLLEGSTHVFTDQE
jgi:hypothetical protein